MKLIKKKLSYDKHRQILSLETLFQNHDGIILPNKIKAV